MYLLPGGSRRCIASCKMHEPGNAAGASWCDLRHPRTDDRNLLAGDFVRKQTVTCFLVLSILFYSLSFADFLCTKYETSWYPSMIYKHTFVLWVFSLQCHCITFDEGLPCGLRFQAMSMFGSSSQSRVAQIIKNRKNPKVDDFRGKCRKIMKYVTKGFIELCRFILSESFYHACFIKKAYSCKSTPRGTLPVQNWYLKSDLWHISVFRDKMCHLILKSKVEFTLCLRLIVFYRSNVVVTFFSILSKTLSVMSGWLSGASKWQRSGTFALGAHMLLLGQWGKGKYLLDT